MRAAIVVALAALIAAPLSANLIRHDVAPQSDIQKKMALEVTLSRDDSMRELWVVTVKAREGGLLKDMFGIELVVIERPQPNREVATLIVPLQQRSPYRSDPGYYVSFLIHDRMLKDARVHFRCGNPLSEVRYDVRVVDYLVRPRK